MEKYDIWSNTLGKFVPFLAVIHYFYFILFSIYFLTNASNYAFQLYLPIY